jgi:thioredoxin reductase
LTDEYCAVNSQGFYAVGDCRKKPFNQVVIAMADGCIAALDIVRKLVN